MDEFEETPGEIIGRELGDGEKILWAGRPPTGLRLRAIDGCLIPFSLMWGGFAIFWEASVIYTGAPIFFALWGIPFVAVGLYFILGRFWVDAHRRARTTYGVTGERVVIVSPGWLRRNVRSLSLATLGEITLSERRDGGGSIWFGPALPGAPYLPNMLPMGQFDRVVPSFELSDDARSVYEILRKAQRLPAK